VLILISCRILFSTTSTEANHEMFVQGLSKILCLLEQFFALLHYYSTGSLTSFRSKTHLQLRMKRDVRTDLFVTFATCYLLDNRETLLRKSLKFHHRCYTGIVILQQSPEQLLIVCSNSYELFSTGEFPERFVEDNTILLRC